LAKRGIELAQKGRCREALPLLKKGMVRAAGEAVKYPSAMLTARCAMSLNQTQTAVETLLLLQREFPRDPEVLYTITHFYSELASDASRELARVAPNSPQAGKLEAEGFEAQGNWDKAVAEYNKILEQDPKQPGIHYRLGRILLSKTPPEAEKDIQEFDDEIKLDPTNASAEFMLGETARQMGRWDVAATHFARASQLDEGFAEAYLALGMSLNSAGKFSDAVSPLERYVKMQPADPAGHYQLGTAYARLGRKPEAEREIELQRQKTNQKASTDHQ
jgi:tetratricopeptide (TPR) repeat protein